MFFVLICLLVYLSLEHKIKDKNKNFKKTELLSRPLHGEQEVVRERIKIGIQN